jgi:ABC-type branched-subunit amino acid transport system substrate-binding protein
MSMTKWSRALALPLSLAMLAAACGSDADEGTTTDTSAGTETETTGESSDTTVAEEGSDTTAADEEAAAGTVEAAPSCAGEGDGTLHFGTVLPETGNLASLGPAEFAAAELAVAEINEAGGVLGADVVLSQGDSGDTSTDIATQTVDRHLEAGADVFVGAASSGVSFTFIDTLVENCKIHFSPANTSPDFTEYDEDDLYFRTAPSDVLQGRVLADLMIADGVSTLAIIALQDPYGEGLLRYTVEPFEEQGGTVVESFTYDPQAASFEAEVDKVVAADADAFVLIGFEESSKILTTAFEKGLTPDQKKIYLVDGNVGNALGENFQPGQLVGVKGTLPTAELSDDFKDQLLGVDPALVDFSYGPETYDAFVISSLAAIAAESDNPAEIAKNINGITRDGEKCSTFAECAEQLGAGTDIDYDGPSGPQTFGPAGEPTEATFAIFSYDEANKIDGEIAPEFRAAKI